MTNELVVDQDEAYLLAQMKQEESNLARCYLQLRGNLSLAEEGLANVTQESASLTTQRDHWLEIAREKDAEIERLQDRLETQKGVIANHVVGEREVERLQAEVEGVKAAHAEDYAEQQTEIERLRKGIEECIGTSSWETIRGDLRLVLRGGSSEPCEQLCDGETPVRASTAEIVLPLSAEPTASPSTFGQDFDKDLAHLDYLRAKYDFRSVDVTFLFSFIDNLWREYSRSQRTGE